MKIAVVGGCGGIGRALTAAALEARMEVVVLDLPASLERHPLEGNVRTIAADATDKAALEHAAAEVGTVDGLVHLTGFAPEGVPVTEIEPAVWDEVLSVNLTSAQHATAAFAPMLSDGGSMVLTGSGLGISARPGYGPYAVAKAGIMALTRQLAAELAPRLRVNCVAPSAVDTAFLRGGTGRSAEDEAPRIDIAEYARRVPLGRIATPEDVAGPILFLLSKAAGYITGQTLHVNGGLYTP